MKRNIHTICLSAFLLVSVQTRAQSYDLVFEISNQEENTVVLGAVKGDDFIVMDSLQAASGLVKFTFDNDNHSGVYRINLGYTAYSRVMNKAPQTIDFIFNKEDIHIISDFKHPTDSLCVVESNENKLWYEVLRKKQEFDQQFNILEKELDHYWSMKDSVKAFETSNEFNRLQMGHDIFLGQKMQQNSTLFVSKIISTYRQPIMDGFLSPTERKEAYQTEFFKTLDFSHEELINSTAYTDKIFEYLVTYNNPLYTKDQRIVAYKQALDLVLPQANQNKKVYAFIKSYLFHGFELLGMPEIIEYIRENYE